MLSCHPPAARRPPPTTAEPESPTCQIATSATVADIASPARQATIGDGGNGACDVGGGQLALAPQAVDGTPKTHRDLRRQIHDGGREGIATEAAIGSRRRLGWQLSPWEMGFCRIWTIGGPTRVKFVRPTVDGSRFFGNKGI
ncbi:hypothetical protein TIFTF001_026950 [Ficus carica]|uniref:Uncharacterized protein n=1 Tax=Ficus carica TaxID=3494 RepID=A0AA88DM38_FICCA|nr:hypothetical protein TIFTF001_026950 [Ficus carica]